jgi:hypothetical protein
MKGILGIGEHRPGKQVILDGFLAIECDHGVPLTQECKDCELASIQQECAEIVNRSFNR